MKQSLLSLLFFLFLFSSTGFAKKDSIPGGTTRFQLAGGVVYSNIDLSRYASSMSFRGLHVRLITHLHGPFFISTEYSSFPVHTSPMVWEDVRTRKFDINGHFSFATQNKRTRVLVLAGLNKHEWRGKRTGYVDLDQLGQGLTEGAYAKVNRVGVNFGCGFTQSLYENIGMFGDFRFCFGNANNFEKVRILDVMTTVGINFSIPDLATSGGRKKNWVLEEEFISGLTKEQNNPNSSQRYSTGIQAPLPGRERTRPHSFKFIAHQVSQSFCLLLRCITKRRQKERKNEQRKKDNPQRNGNKVPSGN